MGGANSISKKNKCSYTQKIIFQFVEISSLLAVIVLTFINKINEKFILLCFAISLIIMLSRQTYTSKINNCFINWLGELSKAIYIFHLVIAHVIRDCFFYLSDITKIILYYSVTFILSAMACFTIRNIRKWKS